MLRTLWQSRRLGMCITNLEGDILDVNDTYCRLLGYGRHDLLQSSIYNLTEHEDALDLTESDPAKSDPAKSDLVNPDVAKSDPVNPDAAAYELYTWYQDVVQQTQRSLLELAEDDTDAQISATVQRGTASVAWVDVKIIDETALHVQLQTRQGDFVTVETDLICGEVTGSELLVLHVVRPLSLYQQRSANWAASNQADVPLARSTARSVARSVADSEETIDDTEVTELAQIDKGSEVTETTMQAWLRNAPEVLEAILPDSVAILDHDGIYQDIKDAPHYISFTAVEESLGKTLEEALPKPLASDLRAALTKVFTSREQQYVRSTLPVADSVRRYETRLHYVDERVCVSATHDITAQVALEQRARQSDAKTKAIIEAIPDSIVILSREGVYQETHLPSNFKFVYHNANWDGQHIDDVPVPPDVAEPLKQHMARLFETKTPQRYTYDIDIEDRPRRREVTLTRIDDTSCVMLVRDLTATIDLGTRLTKAIEALTSSVAPSFPEVTPNQEAYSEFVNTPLKILPDLISRLNRQGILVQAFVPEGVPLLSNFTADTLLGKSLEEVTPANIARLARYNLERAFATGAMQTFSYNLMYQGKHYYREARFIPVSNDEVVSIIRDFSEQYAAQRDLEQRENHLKTLINALPDGIAVFDRAATYLEVNLSKYNTNVPTSVLNLVGKTVYDVLPKAIARRVHDCLERALDSGDLQVCTYEIEQDGQTHSREVRIVPLTATTALGVLRDITTQESTQRQLEQRTHHLQTLLNTLPDAIIQIGTDGYVSQIQVASDFEIVAKISALEGKRLDQVLPPESVEDIHNHMRKAFDTGKLQLRRYQVRRHGVTFYREMRIMRFDEDSVLAVIRDTSERERSQLALEHSERKLRALLQAFPDAIARFNPQGIYLETVHKGDLDLGFSFSGCVGKSLTDLLPKVIANELQAHLEATFQLHHEHTYDYILEQDGKHYYREIRFIYLNKDSCLGIFRDTTEWRELTGALETSLQHSEALLKEVHHRVRNNLQVLSSILHLHAASLKEPFAKQALNDNRRRIQTMAAVHRVLYENESYADIALDQYLRSTLRLFSQELASWKIDLQLDIRAVQVSLDQAIPFGLIANELLGNAARHAFPVGAVSKPRIEVSLYQQGDHIVFQVKDNGVGLPSNFAELCQQNLGISITSSLTQQLDGKVTVDSVNSPEGGSVAVLEFPLSYD